MIRLIHFLVRQKLISGLVVLMVFAAGLASLYRINRESFPEVNLDMVVITTIYRGGSPAEIEQLITIPLEKELRSVTGIDRVKAYNMENVSVIIAYMDPALDDTDDVVDDINKAVGLVTDLPENADRPEIEEITTEIQPVIDIALSLKKSDGPYTTEMYRELRKTARHLEDEIYEIDGVAEVERFGFLDREYLVEVDPDALSVEGLGLNYFLQAIKYRNVDMPSGIIRLGDQEYTLRTRGQFQDVNEIRNVPIVANATGYITKISDVAKVSDQFEEPDLYERFNGHHAIVFRVMKSNQADLLRMSEKVHEVVEKFQKDRNNDSVRVETFEDASVEVSDKLVSLISNALVGLSLLVLVLFFMLGFRLAFTVSMVIPMVFMIVLSSMEAIGLTINTISIFAMVMVLGMIVDFAIVVSENAYRHLQNGLSRREAVEKGTAEIFWPVTVTVLAIVAAFAPLLYMTGLIGKFILSIPVVIIVSLVAAWLQAMFVLPGQLDVIMKRPSSRKTDNTGFEEEKPGVFQRVLDAYRNVLRFALRRRYTTLGSLFVFLIGSVGISSYLVGFILFPPGGENYLEIISEMPQGTKLNTNLKAMEQVETVVRSSVGKNLKNIRTRVGIEEPNPVDPKPGEATHRGTMIIRLLDSSERPGENDDASKILDRLRTDMDLARKEGRLTGEIALEMKTRSHGPPVGKPVSVEIRGKQFDVLESVADRYTEFLSSIDGVQDVSLDLDQGKEEYRFQVLEDRAAMAGLTVMEVAAAIRTAFNGEVASTVNEGDDEIDIVVRFPDSARQSLESIEKVHIANRQGRLIPLVQVAKYQKSTGYSMINRQDYKRVVKVEANVDTAKTTSIKVNELLKKEFESIGQEFPGISVNYGGEQEDAQESIRDLLISFAFALAIIYVLLTAFFHSALTPVVIMSAIPFGMIGVMMGLMLDGSPLSFMSLLGMVSLSGVIVSNTLVLVSFIQDLIGEGLNLDDALVEGGVMRLRPVILTTATTVLGLLPSIVGLGGIDHFVRPLALSFASGLIFATFITLVLIPVLYRIKEDFRSFLGWILKRFGMKLYDPLADAE